MENKKQNKKVLLVLIPIILVIALVVAFFVFRPKPAEGSKAIVIQVVDDEKQSVEYSFRTDAEYLRQAMEEAEGLTFSGNESEYDGNRSKRCYRRLQC